MDKQYQNVIFLQAARCIQASRLHADDVNHGRRLPGRLDWHHQPRGVSRQESGQAALLGRKDTY